MPSLARFLQGINNIGRTTELLYQRNLGPGVRRTLGLKQLGTPEIVSAARPNPGFVKAFTKATTSLPGYKTTALLYGTGATLARTQDSRDPLTQTIENTLSGVGPRLDQFFAKNIPFSKELQNYGRAQEQRGWQGAFENAIPLVPALISSATNTTPQMPTPKMPASKQFIGPTRDIYEVPGTGWFDRNSGRFLGNKPSTTTSGTPVSSNTTIPVRNNVIAPIATNPNTIIRRGDGQDGISDEYRSQLSAWENKRTAVAQTPRKFQPSSSPMPAAATEAAQTGQELWAKLHTGLAKPGGAVGTYNPLMQARGDVPSMADLWSGMKSIQAPTAGPGRTSENVTDEAMAKAKAEGRYFTPSETGGFANALDPGTQQRMQQYATAFQAQKGTEDASAAQRSQDFLNKFKLGTLNAGSYNFPSYDASAMMNAPSALFK